MPRVRFADQNLEVEVPIGTSLLDAARQIDAPEGSAFAAARAIVRRAELNRSEGERALRRAGVVVENIGRGA